MTRHLFPVAALAALGIATVIVSGCASSGLGAQELERARAAVARAEQNPSVGTHASMDLKKAQENLGRAEYVWYEEDGNLDEEEADHVIHYSYLAERYAGTAEAKARKADARLLWERALADQKEATREAKAIGAAQRAKLMELQKQLEELKASQAANAAPMDTRIDDQRGLVITLSDVLFAFDSAFVRREYGAMLDRVVNFLLSNPDYTLTVEGHTDSTGNDAYNQSLSERRADSVRQALIERGVNAGNVFAVGFGESRPVASNSTHSGRSQNRRVEIVINRAAQ